MFHAENRKPILVPHSEQIQCITIVRAQMQKKNPAILGCPMGVTSDTLFKIIAWLNTLASKSESGWLPLRFQDTQTRSGHRLFLWAQCAPLPRPAASGLKTPFSCRSFVYSLFMMPIYMLKPTQENLLLI